MNRGPLPPVRSGGSTTDDGQTDNGQGGPLTKEQDQCSESLARFHADRAVCSRNTQFLSEILQGANDDIRGTIWIADAGCGSYTTRFTPNGNADILQLLGVWAGNGLNNAVRVFGGPTDT